MANTSTVVQLPALEWSSGDEVPVPLSLLCSGFFLHRRNVEPLGRAFEHRLDLLYRLDEQDVAAVSPTTRDPSSRRDASSPNVSNENNKNREYRGSKGGGGSKPSTSIVKMKEEDFDVDWYAVLKLEKLGEGSTDQDIRSSYKRRCLETHPDKQTNHSDEEFKKVQRAFEILSNGDARRAFDSARPFDDTIPEEEEAWSESEFFDSFHSAFERNEKWSIVTPMPKLGDGDTPVADVNKFYDAWLLYKSWRDFSHELELDDVDEGMSREEKRFYQRENQRLIDKRRREELKRIRMLVERAMKHDPRLRKVREEAECRREKERCDRQLEKDKLRMEEQRIKLEQVASERQKEELRHKTIVARKESLKKSQLDLVAFLQGHGLMDLLETNLLLPNKIRLPNVTWLFSKVTDPEEAIQIVASVTAAEVVAQVVVVVAPVVVQVAATPKRGGVQEESTTEFNDPNNNVRNNTNKNKRKGSNKGATFHSSHADVAGNDDNATTPIPAVQVFNAIVLAKEQQVGSSRYGEPIAKKQVVVILESATPDSSTASRPINNLNKQPATPLVTTSTWTEEDLVLLQKAIAKYPGGSVDRWRKMAQMMKDKFTEDEVLVKTKELEAQLRSGSRSIVVAPVTTSSSSGMSPQPSSMDAKEASPNSTSTTEKIAPPSSSSSAPNEEWSTVQQKQLERGLRELKDYKEKDKFQKVATFVEGKGAKQCFDRYKYLCTLNKK